MVAYSVLLLVVLHCFTETYGQTVPTVYGTSFVVAFPPIRESFSSSEAVCRLYISAYVQTTVTVQQAGGSTPISIAAGETDFYEDVGCQARVSDGIETKAIYVTSDSPDNPIAVAIVSSDGNAQDLRNMDMTLMYPIDFADGAATEFYVYNYQKESPDGTVISCGNSSQDTAAFFTVIASQAGALVEIRTPPDYNPGSTVTLAAFQTLTFRVDVAAGVQDFTGRYILSDQPISVISGTLCADATLLDTDSEGVAWSGMPPVAAYTAGEFITYEFFTQTLIGADQTDIYDIVVMASQADTVVNIANIDFTIGRGEIARYQVTDATEKVTCSDKCMVMQISKNNEDTTGICMMQTIPTGGHGTYSAYTNYHLGLLPGGGAVRYYVRVVTENEAGTGDISISGSPTVVEDWTCLDFAGGNRGRYCKYLVQFSNVEVQSVIQSNNPDTKFSAAVYWSSSVFPGRGYCYNTGVAYNVPFGGSQQ